MTPSASAPTKEAVEAVRKIIQASLEKTAGNLGMPPWSVFAQRVVEDLTRLGHVAPVRSPDVGAETEHLLSSLLARIHRDGGHYEVQHGTEKAVRDADEIIANLYASPQPPEPASVRVTDEMEPAAPVRHIFTGNAPGVIGSDNCQICGRWSNEPETAACRDAAPVRVTDESEPDGLRKWREDQLARVKDSSFLKRLSTALASAEPEGMPRLTEAMIRAACKGHYGTDNIDGVCLTHDGIDHSFRDAFKRMWKGIGRAAAPVHAEEVKS